MSYSAWKESVQRRFYEHGMYAPRMSQSTAVPPSPMRRGPILDPSGTDSLQWTGSLPTQFSAHDLSQGDVMESSVLQAGTLSPADQEYLPHCFLTQILSNTLQHRSVSNQPTPLNSPRRDREHSNVFASSGLGHPTAQARQADSFSSILQSKSKVLLAHETGIAQKALRANQELQDLLQYVRHVNRMNQRKPVSEEVAPDTTTDAGDEGYSADDWESESEGKPLESTR